MWTQCEDPDSLTSFALQPLRGLPVVVVVKYQTAISNVVKKEKKRARYMRSYKSYGMCFKRAQHSTARFFISHI